jgi:glycosyltransferase involved in cell wall biosynthesis
MPAHNTAPWIEEAIRSVLQQTFESFEIVIVDDGSSDGTDAAVNRISDSRIRLLRQDRLGASAARNAAIAASKGSYLAFLDSDDAWAPEALARRVAVLESRPEIDLVFCWSAIMDEAGAPTGYLQTARAGRRRFEDVLTGEEIGNGSCVVLRRELCGAAGLFDPNLRAATDYDMWLRAALARPDNVWCIPAPLTRYRRRPGQITSDWRLAQGETDKVLAKVRKLAPHIPRAAWERAEAVSFRAYAFMAYEAGACGAAARLLARGVRHAPWFSFHGGRTWSLAAAIAARCVLPEAAFQRVKGLLASTNKLSSGRVSKSSASGSSPL